MSKVFKVGGCAGHAGFGVTAGKRTPDNEYEWDFNNIILVAFENELQKYDNVEFNRFDDRTGRRDVPLITRTNEAKKWGADIYISVHNNALNGQWGNHTGTETFRGNCSNSLKLAQLLQSAQVKVLGARDRGVKTANLHITRVNSANGIPSALTESLFMDSRIDIVKLRDKKLLEEVGREMAKAVAVYANLKLKIVKQPVQKELDNMKFKDVPKSHSFYEAIEYLAEKRIINGFPDGTFRPNEPLTRGQLAAILYRLEKNK